MTAGCRVDTAPEPATNTPVVTTASTTPTTAASTTLATAFRSDGEANPACLNRARFGDPAASDYVLPYPSGDRYRVLQTYCAPAGGHRNQLAYDFSLGVRAQVVAARGGVVKDVREDSPDNGKGNGEHNFVLIEHADGSVAFYAHLMQYGVDVRVGDVVRQGQPIARSGNSGLTLQPHLHFGVYRGWPTREGYDAPVNFRNATGFLDLRGSLVEGGVYEALGD